MLMLMQTPPKLVYDDSGHLVEVIVSAEDYLAFLRQLVEEADWELLPLHLQDAIDRLLIDEVRAEKAEAIELSLILDEEL
jgi:hypothetical protein